MRIQYFLSSLFLITTSFTLTEPAKGQIPLDQIPTLEDSSPDSQPNPSPETVPNQGQPIPIPRNETSQPPISDPYLLGPGDTIQINVFEEEQFSGENGRQRILPDGSITLPLVGAINVSGLTLEQTANLITQKLSNLLKRPIVNVRLVNARPVRVTIVGEVQRPGTYAVSPEEAGSVVQGQVLGARTVGAPSLTDVISLAGGITDTAQIREIEVIRQQRGNETKTMTIDLWQLLQSGGGQGDITLRPRDRIVVPRSETVTASEATQLAESTFAPDSITVNVVGEVERPGRVEVEANTPLNQALLAAGGFNQERADKSEVTLIRLNDDGTVTEREVPINFQEGIDKQTNPVLQDQDIVFVERSGITKTSERLNTFTNPINSILNLINIFN